MGMQVGSNRKGPSSEINVTPLIDIVLVLLIIFMVLTPIMLKYEAANIPKKPNPNDPPPPPGPAPIVVGLNGRGELSLNEEPVAPEQLADKVTERLKTADSKKLVFFKVENDALYGDAVKFMDICKGAGAKTLGIMTPEGP